MQDIKEKAAEIVQVYDTFREGFDLPAKKTKFEELNAKSATPDIWNDPATAKKLMQETAWLRQEIEEVEALDGEIVTLKELVEEDAVGEDFNQTVADLEKRVNKLKINLLLSGPMDTKNAIISIHAGQGGTEAMDWANMLYRMYLRFCERRSWETETFDMTAGEEAGIKTVIFKVTGAYAYGYLKHEAGTHRLVRQSPFNADKLRQTSFALVEVLPELEEESIDFEIKESDLDWQFYRSSSQGGQNVQKVSTAVRLKHIPSGIVVTAQAQRFQEQNRKIALDLLRAKLWVLEQERAKAQVKELKGEYRPASWGTQIRSYVLHPYKMVKDLRTDVETGNTEAVLDGDLDQFIEAELQL